MNARAVSDSTDTEDDPHAPRRNPALVGQADAQRALADGFGAGRLAHAWLLTGPKGIGKATLAYRFARHVLARGRADADAGPSLFGDTLPEPEPAGGDDPLFLAPEDPVFQRVAAGGHSDLMTLERTPGSTGKLRTEIVVEDVRNVIHFLNLTAGEGGWRVVIVDSADDLNPNAANALLKVLEEPPPRALLLLVSHNPGRLLPTIRSRCRKLRLAALESDTLDGLLQHYLPALDPDERAAVAALSDGSIGRALDLARADGAALNDQILDFLSQMPSPNIAELQAFGATMTKADGAERFETMADLLRRHLAGIVRQVSGGMPRAEGRNTAVLEHLTAAGGLDRWLEVWDKADDLLHRTERIHLDRKQVILNIFLTIAEAARG